MSEGAGYQKKIRIIRLSLAEEIRHGLTVSNLAFRVGKRLELPEEVCHDLAVAGFLHDIGKLELQKYIYGREEETLTIEELKYVRMHAQLGAGILKEQGYPPHIVEWVYCHHENCDGSGYPRNLTKDQIPFPARIIRVCDVFSALISRRPYRDAFDPETAVELMIDEIKNYDLKVFLAFQRVVHEESLEDILEEDSWMERLESCLEQNEE